MSLYSMSWPRQSYRFFWITASLYKTMALRTYTGLPSSWAWTSWAQSWTAFFSKLGMWSEVVIGSARTVTASGVADPPDHCLPSVSITSLAPLALLTRWCSATQKSGGFCTNLRRGAAEVL